MQVIRSFFFAAGYPQVVVEGSVGRTVASRHPGMGADSSWLLERFSSFLVWPRREHSMGTHCDLISANRTDLAVSLLASRGAWRERNPRARLEAAETRWSLCSSMSVSEAAHSLSVGLIQFAAERSAR